MGKPVMIWNKPDMWCLTLHQTAWEKVSKVDVVHWCKACKKYFKYPTKVIELPIYHK